MRQAEEGQQVGKRRVRQGEGARLRLRLPRRDDARRLRGRDGAQQRTDGRQRSADFEASLPAVRQLGRLAALRVFCLRR